MNSGTTSTELNDMLTNFVDYVDSFYGVNDPLYPMMGKRQNNHSLSLTFLEQQRTTYQCVVMTVMNYALGRRRFIRQRESQGHST